MRKWVYSKLKDDASLGLLVLERIYSSGSVGQRQANEPRPFVVFRGGEETKFHRDSTVTRQQFFVYAHAEPGSTVLLDELMGLIQQALRVDSSERFEGQVIMDCDWLQDSEDLYDDVFGTTTRYGTYSVTARK